MQHYAMGAPARSVCCTSAPLYMQLFNNDDFIFNCDYKFLDRFAEEENYFVEAPNLLPGFNGIETNFFADVRRWFTRENVYALEEKGGFRQSRDRAHDAFSMRVRFAKTMMFLHLSGWSAAPIRKRTVTAPVSTSSSSTAPAFRSCGRPVNAGTHRLA